MEKIEKRKSKEKKENILGNIKQYLQNHKVVVNSAIYIIIGALLGILSEVFLIKENLVLIQITQSYIFWGAVVCIIAIFTKRYRNAVMYSFEVLLSMNLAYYLTRLVIFNYANIYHIKIYTLLSLTASTYLSTLVFVVKTFYQAVKKMIEKRKEKEGKERKDKLNKDIIYVWILMTVNAIAMFGIEIYSLKNNTLISTNLMYPVACIIVVTYVIYYVYIMFFTILKKYKNIVEKKHIIS